jgi:hypothetical protein
VVEISVSGGDEAGQPSGMALSLTVWPLSEGNLRRLNYQVGVNEPLTKSGRGTGLLKSGQTLVVEHIPAGGVQVGVPIVKKMPNASKLFMNTPRNPGRYLIVITPRLVRTDVEEAQLELTDVEPTDHEVGRCRHVTLLVAVDRSHPAFGRCRCAPLNQTRGQCPRTSG